MRSLQPRYPNLAWRGGVRHELREVESTEGDLITYEERLKGGVLVKEERCAAGLGGR